MIIIVSFRQDSYVLTAEHTAGAAAVYKVIVSLVLLHRAWLLSDW